MSGERCSKDTKRCHQSRRTNRNCALYFRTYGKLYPKKLSIKLSWSLEKDYEHASRQTADISNTCSRKAHINLKNGPFQGHIIRAILSSLTYKTYLYIPRNYHWLTLNS